jgi:DNA-binding MarR family transcriptional regulator
MSRTAQGPTAQRANAAYPRTLAKRPAFLLAQAHGGARAIYQSKLNALGLRVKEFALLITLATEGRGSQNAIGEMLRVDRTTMTVLVDSLERQGYVERLRNPEDRRAHLLTITAAGREIQDTALQAIIDAEEEFLVDLTPSERSTLVELLGSIAARVGKAPPDPGPRSLSERL